LVELDELKADINRVHGKVTEVIVNSAIWTDELAPLAGLYKVSQMSLGPFCKCMIKYLPNNSNELYTYVVNMNSCKRVS
jgi:hypothetical protein